MARIPSYVRKQVMPFKLLRPSIMYGILQIKINIKTFYFRSKYFGFNSNWCDGSEITVPTR